MDEEEKTEKPKKRFGSWLKYILFIELIAFMPYYSIKLLKKGRTDELADFVVKMADIAHNEEAEGAEPAAAEARTAECPQCGGGNVEIFDTTEDVWKWKCNDCGNVFEYTDVYPEH